MHRVGATHSTPWNPTKKPPSRIAIVSGMRALLGLFRKATWARASTTPLTSSADVLIAVRSNGSLGWPYGGHI